MIRIALTRTIVASVCALFGILVGGSKNAAALGVVYTAPPDPIPNPLLSGDTLNVVGVNSFVVMTSQIGSVINLQAGGNIFGATVRGTLNAYAGAVGVPFLTIDGGTINAWDGLYSMTSLMNGGYLNLAGGKINNLTATGGTIDFRSGEFHTAFFTSNTVVNLYATAGEGDFRGNPGSTLNFYGGSLTPTAGPRINFGGTIHLFMQSAALGGQPIPGLIPGATVTVTQRDVTLAGLMQNGSPVDMFLNSNTSVNSKFTISASTPLQVTLVPEPAGALLAISATACLLSNCRRANRSRALA